MSFSHAGVNQKAPETDGGPLATLASLTIYMDPPLLLLSLAVMLSPRQSGPGSL